MQSHFRRFTKDEWAGEQDSGPPPDSRAVHHYSSGDVMAHCAGSRERWERLWGDRGKYEGDRISELAPQTQGLVLLRVIERKGARQRIAMAKRAPKGWKTVEKDVVPHLFMGQTVEDVL